jgi:hypothetical protein
LRRQIDRYLLLKTNNLADPKDIIDFQYRKNGQPYRAGIPRSLESLHEIDSALGTGKTDRDALKITEGFRAGARIVILEWALPLIEEEQNPRKMITVERDAVDLIQMAVKEAKRVVRIADDMNIDLGLDLQRMERAGIKIKEAATNAAT